MKPALISIPKIPDSRGSLSFIEGKTHIPFEIKRMFWIYDIPDHADRAGHAHYSLEEFIVAINGSLEVHLTDGSDQSVFLLNRPDIGLYLPGGHWRHLKNFSRNACVMVFASTEYNEQDYIRDFDSFLKTKAI